MKRATMKIMKGEEVVEMIEGGFIRADGDKVIMQLVEGGEAHFPKDDDHWLEMSDELFVMPGGVVKVTIDDSGFTSGVKAPAAPKAAKGLTPLKPGSAIEQVVNIIKASGLDATKDRKALLPMIMAAMGKSEGWASTYHQNAKKYL